MIEQEKKAWVRRIQERLVWLGYDLRPDGPDGDFGPITLAAVKKFQLANGLEASGQPTAATLAKLFPGATAPNSGVNWMQAKFIDYVLNGLTSKINWAAGAMVAALVLWLQTKFGFTLPQDLQNSITIILVSAFAFLIGVLRTFFNKPKVVEGQKVDPVK